jgi:yecA family protein
MTYSTCNALHQTTELCASEAHGLATGLLCGNHAMKPAQWLSELLPHSAQAISEQTTALLVNLFNSTRELLLQQEFAFDLFLPDDDAPFSERLIALAAWCQGFLLGISKIAAENESPEVREIVKDIIEFTKLDTDSAGDEDDEIAFVEITEYCRSAVLLLHDQFQQQ